MAKVKAIAAAMLAATAAPAWAAEPVMVQCGREYQAARTAGTLNGADWNVYRVACAERLKAASAAPTPAPIPGAAPQEASAKPPATPSVVPPASVPADSASTSPVAPSPGMAAMHARQKRCGAEWTAGKALLVAQTPGLTWPKFWSQCNTRMKTTGR